MTLKSLIVGLLIATQVVGALGSVAMIGKPRKTMTSGLAMVVLVLNALTVWGLLYVAGH